MPRDDRYTSVAIALHWTIAGLVLANILLGFLHEDQPREVTRVMMWWHKSFGLTILLLTLARLGWRLGHRPPPLPAAMPSWQMWLARLTHWGFYAVLLALPLTGWIFQSTSPRGNPIPFYGLHWPFIPWLHDLPMDQRKSLTGEWAEWHERLAWTAVALLALHVFAALKHWVVDRDNVMRHMIPVLKERRPVAKDAGKTAF